MKDAILFFAFVVVANFFFRGDPNLYDLLHAKAIAAAKEH